MVLEERTAVRKGPVRKGPVRKKSVTPSATTSIKRVLERQENSVSVDWMQSAVLAWYRQYGRDSLPWQQTITPYRVWISEIMLQQTQVQTVIAYFNRFVACFPTVEALAGADLEAVLTLWTGLGYYARARNLYQTACRIVQDHQGVFPQTVEALVHLPGIGRSTAGAIVSLGWGLRAPILDGNVKRVVCRLQAVDGVPTLSTVQKQLWQLAEDYTPHKHVRAFNQAMMDLGALICTPTQPACDRCPLQAGCVAYQHTEQHLFPARKKPVTLPTKTVFVLLAYRLTSSSANKQQPQIWLEKRPASGIWGGLWSFPEARDRSALRQLCRQGGWRIQQQGLMTGLMKTKRLALKTKSPVLHTFSHFHLEITPVEYGVSAPEGARSDISTESAMGRWFACEDIETIGLPAPIKKMLGQFFADFE